MQNSEVIRCEVLGAKLRIILISCEKGSYRLHWEQNIHRSTLPENPSALDLSFNFHSLSMQNLLSLEYLPHF